MTHYLRTKSGDNIIEINTSKDDLSANVYIENYSHYLLDLDYDIEKQMDFIRDIEELSEIRGYYFERLKPDEMKPRELTEDYMKTVAVKWNLYYSED